MKFKDVLKRLLDEGWVIRDQKGGHIHMVHPKRPGKLTIPSHGKKDLKPGTLHAIWKRAGLK